MTISPGRRDMAHAALRAAGFAVQEVRELLAGPKGLRDELACAAIAGLTSTEQGFEMNTDDLAMCAYRVADACLIERERDK